MENEVCFLLEWSFIDGEVPLYIHVLLYCLQQYMYTVLSVMDNFIFDTIGWKVTQPVISSLQLSLKSHLVTTVS